jgi:hypothetical protein
MSWKCDGRYFSTQGIEEDGGITPLSDVVLVMFFMFICEDEIKGRWDNGDALRFRPRMFIKYSRKIWTNFVW